MAWQDVLPLSATRIDAEQERELRLAAQAGAGAEWALAALVARYQPPVTRYLTRLTGDADLARSLAERIFLRMGRRLRGPQGGHQLRLWLLRACTEAGLDALRGPRRASPARLESPRFAGLLTGRVSDGTTSRLRAGWEALGEVTGSTRRQVRKLIWNSRPTPEEAGALKQTLAGEPSSEGEPETSKDPREVLRYRLIRAVLAELPYGDAQCLALHLVASLNQAEAARALGITQSATRRRIVHGLQLFAQRYEAAAASLGLPLGPLVGQSMEQIEEAHLPADVETTVAVEPALDPSSAAPSQSTQPTPIWHGAYAGPGEDVGLSSLPDELLTAGVHSDQPGSTMDGEPVAPDMPVMAMTALVTPVVIAAVIESTAEKREPVVDAAPFVVMPTYQDRMVVVVQESPPGMIELALSVEGVSQLVEAAPPAGARDREVSTARLVPVLTPGIYGAIDAITGVPGAETPTADSVADAEPAVDASAMGARLVPVLTPGATDSSTERTDTMLRAVILDGGLGAFGAANGPTVPLPGREARRAARTMIAPEEEHPRAG